MKKDEVFGTVESVKAVSDLFAPVTGVVVKVNTVLHDKPEAINEDPYKAGWLIEIEMSDPGQVDGLLSAADYKKLLAEQECCLSAQEIHDEVRARGSSVGIASVYRALEGMDALGLVQRIDLGDGVARFEPAHAGGDHHHHLVCDDCGKVEPFEDPGLESAIERVADGRGYTVAAHEVVLRGACEDCRHDGA